MAVETDVIRFLRDVGKHFPLGGMIARESVRSRMAQRRWNVVHGIQLSGAPGLRLPVPHRQYGCTMQIGGSDQWGNITAAPT